ncbi:MAG TPA: hypothetical protein VNV42_15775 [Solirubrobacteraceae bacterium]|jgi:hypothetical protein|nr:hypothetical protein [Solirubrobacteraceae bacterium]
MAVGERLGVAARVRPGSRGALGSRLAWPRSGFVLLGAGAVAAVAATHLIDYGVYHLRYDALNANLAVSWSHKVDAAALGVGAAISFVHARRRPARHGTWLATAGLLALLFVAEVTELHTAIGSLNHGKLLYAPLLVALVFCVWRLTRDGAHRAALLAAAALLVVSYTIHVLDPHHIARTLGWQDGGWAFQCVVALKEGTELAGVLVALTALAGTAVAGRRSVAGRPGATQVGAGGER